MLRIKIDGGKETLPPMESLAGFRDSEEFGFGGGGCDGLLFCGAPINWSPI